MEKRIGNRMDWYDLDEVLAAADMQEVARRLGMEVEKRGANLVALCPFHEDTRPSLVLYPREAGRHSHYHCFSCHEHGYAVDLVKRVQGLDFRPAVEWLARSLGVTPRQGLVGRGVMREAPREDALAFAQRVFEERHDESEFAKWCAARHFDGDFAYGFGLRCLPAGSALVHALRSETFGRRQELIDGLLSIGLLLRLRPERKNDLQTSLDLSEEFRDYFHDGRVLIPIRGDRNRLVGFAGRYRPKPVSEADPSSNSAAKYLLTPGFRKAEVLFNADRARAALHTLVKAGESRPMLYVVEGFLDAVRLQSLGLPVVAVMGSTLSDSQRKGLINLVEEINLPGDTHLGLRLFFDRDAAGFDGANRAVRQLIGHSGVEVEWVGFAAEDHAVSGKDPDEILALASQSSAEAILEQHSLPAVGILLAASLGYKDATPLVSDDLWRAISHYPRERALLQTARALRALSGAAANWEQRLEELAEPRPQWATALLPLLRPHLKGATGQVAATVPAVLSNQEARLNHARMLAEHGSRRGELPCDDETWRVLDRNAQIFNSLALDRLRQETWRPAAACDAVHLPRKLSGDEKMLGDPRRKVMPHPADLHLQQFLMNELLTERRDFAHEGPRAFSDCIPAVRWYGTEKEVRVTGYFSPREFDPSIDEDERGPHDEATLSFAYQIDMDVLEGRHKPSDQGMFRPYIECWRDYMGSLDRQAKAIGEHVYVLRLDAKRYYDEIQRYVVRDRLLASIEQALTVSGAEDFADLLQLPHHDAGLTAERLVDLLCGSLYEHDYRDPDDGGERHSAPVKGIPQGPVISAWIGTIVMFPLDAAARAFMRETGQRNPSDADKPRAGYARYVDDIILLADSEARLNALREAVQNAASRLDLTLVRKGDAVAPGTPEDVMQQLNSGRILAPSVPAWEPPMIGDGETGWGMSGDDSSAIDRQSALHLLRHPSLLDEPSIVHQKVHEAMQAPDLRPSDLGKCARAVWWQVATQAAERSGPITSETWPELWRAFRQRWVEVSTGHAWAAAYGREGYDVLFAIEGLDMLMDWSPSMQKGRTKEWIKQHGRSLDSLAAAILQKEDLLQGVSLKRNRAHIQSRVRKVQWKALQRVPAAKAPLHVESQRSAAPTLTHWLCLAAMLLNRYDANRDGQSHPLDQLPSRFEPNDSVGPDAIKTACAYIQAPAIGGEPGVERVDAEASKIALQFLVANTAGPPRHSRWEILRRYSDLIGNGILQSRSIIILPPVPVADAGMLGYVQEVDGSGVKLYAFESSRDARLPSHFVGATMTDVGPQGVPSLAFNWKGPQELAHGLQRFDGDQSLRIVFKSLEPANRARFAADLFETLHVIQQADAGEGKEWVVIMAHVAHEPVASSVKEVGACKLYLVSVPLESANLGVSAWVRDGRGGLRSVSVPGGQYTKLWRLGCAVSDALEMGFDLPDNETSTEADEAALAHPNQIQDYVLRQQLSKLRGTLIADAQVQGEESDGLPRTVRRSLEILRRFDPALDPAAQVKLVLYTEAETNSMAMRLQHKGASDLRDRLHLLPALVLQRLPLSVLEWLPLPHDVRGEPLRTDLALILALAQLIGADHQRHSDDQSNHREHFGSAHALHIGLALAATGSALRGLVASAWGAARHRDPAQLSATLPIPPGWNSPDAGRQDPQMDYETACKFLRDDNWAGARDATPWQWMLALLGILDSVAPQVLDGSKENPLHAVYEQLRLWQSAPGESIENQQWAWPYDDLPTYKVVDWNSLMTALPSATSYVDRRLGMVVRQIEAPAYRRHRDDSAFTDADSQQWILAKLQYSGLGSNGSVARVQRGRSRFATWTEVRRRSDNELLSVHTLDDKVGRWWSIESAAEQAITNAPFDVDPTALAEMPENRADAAAVPPAQVESTAAESVSEERATRESVGDERLIAEPTVEPYQAEPDTAEPVTAEPATAAPGRSEPSVAGLPSTKPTTSAPDITTVLGTQSAGSESVEPGIIWEASKVSQAPVGATQAAALDWDATRHAARESQRSSWSTRGEARSQSHMRVALLQWRIEESYSHPIAEVGLCGLGVPELERSNLLKELDGDGVLARAYEAAARGKEHGWPEGDLASVLSWPEHRRRRFLKRALDACQALKVDLLVLPEVSVRRDTIEWLEDELSRQYPDIAVLAGTYRHFGRSIPDRVDSKEGIADIHPLMAPLTLLWRPDDALSKTLFGDDSARRTMRFVRGKKYRAVAANEVFRPDWRALQPLFGIDQLLDQLGNIPNERVRGIVKAVWEKMPSLRYCMELVCSELFLLTSPANRGPLRKEVGAMASRFAGFGAAEALAMVDDDIKKLGEFLSVEQTHSVSRRTILLVPAATSRSNDYWHAGQASVLASGTATVFCNAAKSAFSCGGSCFIGIDSATKPNGASAGLIETLTPYHGWRKGILSAKADGALSEDDQAMVVVDLDPVHVVSGRPRPQLLPEPMVLVAYLPVVELLDPNANRRNMHSALVKDAASHFKKSSRDEDIQNALGKVGTAPKQRKTPDSLWRAFGELLKASKPRLDVSRLDVFAKHFADDKAIRERLLAWERDREQQPHAKNGRLSLEPAWLDFLEVDLTLQNDEELPTIKVPPWQSDGLSRSGGLGET
ncbi:CHC2 zinc finger domain-containing protein [Burkholderia multivorans]|uniref:CHC2 zinc finger domain-containing protein n=1 Tax=Burkholderia multivorans TaxID=87883 RepID=UPI002B241DDC|nr:CHC2 zinc finger domain-containing protein [Burkholderia multivorans]MEB2513422.1 CHC2 zinc finger domain-containing protein [Burkholderia multivorans]MEB2522894.1 CHC2 zinc finger domain-containing protein [Burkholderia multivorans]MEB2576891.1 CHC2 zinc finger domain-containing protein [Burkholderia multivorans]MEB2595049.1 CHC2 zinc finger domain-containing protein [Burkholderia multivorans]